jgi:hypothetical protein
MTVTTRPRKFITPAICLDASGTIVILSGSTMSSTCTIGTPNNQPAIVIVIVLYC